MAQIPNFDWARSYGGTNYDYALSIAADAGGNVYTTGYFVGTADFDPGSGTLNLTSAGGYDIYIMKMDPAGNLLWVKQMGGTGDDLGYSITTDINGDICITGWFEQTVDFDPGPGTQNFTSGASFGNPFIQKLDPSGNLVWVKQISCTSLGMGISITTDASGNVYTTGSFEGTADFDTGPGVLSIASNGTNLDIFIHKMDPAGNFIWSRQMGGTGIDYGNWTDIAPNGDLITTGSFYNTVDFDPGPGVQNLTSYGQMDSYVQRMDQDGNFLWVKQLGGSASVSGYSVAIDNIGNIITTGYFQSTADFDPGSGTQNLTSAGSTDIYIEKMDPAGNLVWVKQIKGTYGQIPRSSKTDANGNIYITGYFQGLTDFDPGPATNYFSSPSNTNSSGFLLKLDNSGDYIWAEKIGSNSDNYINGVALNTNGDIYACGYFQTTQDFDPGTGNAYLTSAGSFDAFVQKFSTCLSGTSSQTITACNTYTWPANGNTYNTSGAYTTTLTNVNGCDSVVALNLTIHNSNSSYQTITACNSYTWSANGNNYNTSGIYNTTLTNHNGCDSLATLNLTIHNNNTGTETITNCNAYTWPANGNTYNTSGTYTATLTNVNGCDSVVTLNLTIHNSNTGTETITNCNAYTWPTNGNTYNTSGTYTAMLTNVNGCDSVVTLNLTIHNSNTGTETITNCNAYTWPANGNTYNTSGTYTATLTNVNGCDSVVTLNLTIYNNNTGTETITNCNAYTWPANGNTYNTSGTYTATLTNVNGCDSVVTLNLTINNSNTGTETITNCNAYTWPANGNTYNTSGTYTATLTNVNGCDSVVTLNLTIHNSNSSSVTISACGSYTWTVNGTTYITSGIYTSTIINSSGCDSLITLDLTIENIDAGVTQNGITLTANDAGASYQWIDCNNGNTAIAGATGQVFNATQNGSYAVIISSMNCTDTSDCYTINTTGIDEMNGKNNYVLFPNPAINEITLYSSTDFENTAIRITDVNGKIIYIQKMPGLNSILFPLDAISPGVYFMEIRNNQHYEHIKFIKQ